MKSVQQHKQVASLHRTFKGFERCYKDSFNGQEVVSHPELPELSKPAEPCFRRNAHLFCGKTHMWPCCKQRCTTFQLQEDDSPKAEFSCGAMQYENRRPIGLERVIRGVKASAVRAFFERWYHPGLMAVIVSGDFKDSDAVVGQIRHNLESCHPHNPGPPPPVPRHAKPPTTNLPID